ncbi:MAG: class I SAM-dependent methyltransferase [Sulfurimonas sp.]
MARVDTLKFYSNAIKKHGVTAQGLCWHSKTVQQLRFEVIDSLLPQALTDYTLADAGCGFGDFFCYLKEKNRLPKKYIGIDIHPTMCEVTAQRTKQETMQRDITHESLPIADFYVASGSLNLLTPYESVACIQNCYASVRKAFIFNILEGEKSSEVYNYMTKEQLLDIAKELKVRDVHFLQNYLENDITVAFYK